jgi:hypothetical protein
MLTKDSKYAKSKRDQAFFGDAFSLEEDTHEDGE